MANGYYGIQTAGAAMSGMNAAYNRNINKLANLQMYERQEMRRDKAMAFSQGQSRLNASLNAMNVMANYDKNITALLGQLPGLDLEGPVGRKKAAEIYSGIVSFQNQKTRMNTLMAENPTMFAPGAMGAVGQPTSVTQPPAVGVPDTVQPVAGTPTMSIADVAPSPAISQIGDISGMVTSRERVTVSGQPKYFDPKTNLYHDVKKGYISGIGDVLEEDFGINEAVYLEKAKSTLDKGGSDIIALGRKFQNKTIKSTEELKELVRQSISPMNTMLQRIHAPWTVVGKLPSKMVGHNLTSIKSAIAKSNLKSETKQALSEVLTATMNAGELEGDVGTFGMNLDKDALIVIHASIEKIKPKITARIESVIRKLMTTRYSARGLNVIRKIGGVFSGDGSTVTGAQQDIQRWEKARMTPEQKTFMVEETYKSVMQDLEKSDTFQETIYDSAAAIIKSGAQFMDANGQPLTGSALVNKAQEVARTAYTEALLNAINTHINAEYPTYDIGKKPMLDRIGSGIKKAVSYIGSNFMPPQFPGQR